MRDTDPTKLSNFELVTAIKLLVKKDHEANGRLIRFLKEVEQRQLHLERGCSTMELFCETVLGLSETQARTRVRAMRLTYAVPLAEEKIRQGELTLSVAALAQQRFAQAEKTGVPLTGKDRAGIVDQLVHCSLRDAERVLAEMVGGPAPSKEKKTAYAGGTTRLEFTASATLMENIERLQELLAHKNFEGRLDLLFEYVSELALAELEKKTFAEPSAAVAKTENITRHIPAQVQRAVWVRDRGACQYRDEEGGRICGSRRWVQIDHITEFSRGGRHDITNLRLLCGAHNRFVFQRNLKAEEQAVASPPAPPS
jgi:hypothetical protein